MDIELLEKNESVVVEMGHAYFERMEFELGKKYKNKEYEIYPVLKPAQFMDLKTKYNLTDNELNDLYAEFLKLKPTDHLKKLLDAFHASGGNIDIEPSFDEKTGRLQVAVNFVIKDATLKKIEGLSPIEDIFVKMNALLQIDSVLSDPSPDGAPSF